MELNETVEEALRRELKEETGLSGTVGEIVGVFSGPHRDPRKPTATIAFFVRGRPGRPRGGSDAATAEWVPLSAARLLAFDHEKILRTAVRRRRRAQSAG